MKIKNDPIIDSVIKYLQKNKIGIKEFENQLIVKAVELNNGSKAGGANLLGLSTRSIELKFKEWGLQKKKKK
ncbi:MAG: hypothetical protein K8R21_01945 [Leptospira sp.]|nr:hypothetical protein [Leptospira sp.]